jgi:hypothetical protein
MPRGVTALFSFYPADRVKTLVNIHATAAHTALSVIVRTGDATTWTVKNWPSFPSPPMHFNIIYNHLDQSKINPTESEVVTKLAAVLGMEMFVSLMVLTFAFSDPC